MAIDFILFFVNLFHDYGDIYEIYIIYQYKNVRIYTCLAASLNS